MSLSDRHYFKELRLQQFRGLLAVVKSASFSLAATSLGLTKASVWQQVRALEEEFGCVLIESTGRRVRPTAHGLRLAEMAAPLVEGFDSLKNAFTADLAKIPPALSVATTPSCLAYELRDAVKATRARFPSAHLTFHDRNSPAAIELVQSGEADIAVAARFEEWPQTPTLERIPLTAHPFVICAPVGHPLLTRTPLRLQDLQPYPILLPGPTANCRPHMERLLRQAGVWDHLHIVLECSFPGSLLEYVDSGLGISLTPAPQALLASYPLPNPSASPPQPSIPGRNVVLRDCSEMLGHEPIFLIRRRGWVETPIATFFREALVGKTP